MALDVNKFLLSLTAAVAGLCVPPIALGSDIFAVEANEAVATGGVGGAGPYAVLRPYGGPAPAAFPGPFNLTRPRDLSVQCLVTANKASKALGLCQAIFDAFYDDEENPRCHWMIDAKMLDPGGSGALVADGDVGTYTVRLVSLKQPPAIFSGDTEGRRFAVFNFDIRFEL